jgi:hypothetical protein
VQGRFRGEPGVCILTSKGLVLVNDRLWKPDVVRIDLTPQLNVQGWQDNRVASLMFQGPGVQEVVDLIPDRPLAQMLAQRVRARLGGGPGPG